MKNTLATLSPGLLPVFALAQYDSAFAHNFQQELDALRISSGSAGMEAALILPAGCVLDVTSGVQTAYMPIDTLSESVEVGERLIVSVA